MVLETVKSPVSIIGNYKIDLMIAEGGMGTVYKARHQGTGQVVALKVMPLHLAKNPVLMRRFEKEYHAARAIEHPNIVRSLDFGFEKGCPFLAMEFVEGESLGKRLERENRLPEAAALRIITQVAQGLHRAHKLGLVHRDVKPDNILLTPDGQAKLTDLGLVKELETDLNLTRTGRGLGTPHFMAPEQFRNAKKADARCDIYSLAATLYMLVTGDLPFKSCGPLDAWMKKINNDLTPPRQLFPALSERVDWAIRRAMSPDPNHRPATCREFIEDLSGQSTRKIPHLGKDTPSANLWYLVYRDEDEVVHTVKGSVEGVRRSLKEGSLGDPDKVRASRTKLGPFDFLRHIPEFRDLALGLPPASSSSAPPPAPSDSQTLPALAPLLEPGTSPRPGRKKPDLQNTHLSLAPHIELVHMSHHSDCWKWLGLMLLALASAVAGYFLIPFLGIFRLP